MSGLNLVGKVINPIDDQELELTRLIIYDLKESKRQSITQLYEEHKTLEELRVMDKATLVVAEVLTESAKWLILRHQKEVAAKMPDKPKDTQLYKTLRSLEDIQVGSKEIND